MHSILHKGMDAPNIRETRERGEREQHTEPGSPYKTDENPERIIEEEISEQAETDQEEKL